MQCSSNCTSVKCAHIKCVHVLQLDKYSYDAETEKILARKDAEISRLMDDIGNVQVNAIQ